MQKQNLIAKKIQKLILSINVSIESYFNKIHTLKSNFKKTKFINNNKVFLALGTMVILTLSYFLIPTFYNKEAVKLELKNQIMKKYNIDIKYNEDIRYALFPKPHFNTKNLSLSKREKEIAIAKNVKFFIPFNNFFSKKEIEVKDLIFLNTDFKISKNDLVFFKDLLFTKPNENKIVIKNSKIFFKNKDDEVLFINKIYNSEFKYDSNNLENVLSSKNAIFNIPYKILIENDQFNKKILTKFKSSKIRLNLENEIDYNEKTKKGFLDILFISKNTSLKFKIFENSLDFDSVAENFYSGSVDFKPFYLSANFNYDGVSSRNFFDSESILFDIIQSEIFNNDNLNFNLTFNIKNIINSNELNNLILKVGVEEGNISLEDSSIMWKDDLEIVFAESLLNFDKNEINLVGKTIINVKDKDDFYSSYQISKKNRKDIKEIKFDFIYNFSENKISFDNVKINNKSNIKVDEFINIYNSAENKNLNKIRFKNFVNSFFNIYSG